MDLNAAIERLVDERVRKALAEHVCTCRGRHDPPRTAYTIREVAESLGLSRRQVYRLAERDELPTCRIGGKLLVLAAELAAFLAAR